MRFSPMNSENYFLRPEGLSKTLNKKVEFDVVKGTQGYVEKIINDIINRSGLLARHADSDLITATEISIVVEKDFDYTFGLRSIMPEKNLPTNDHIERMAELSKQR